MEPADQNFQPPVNIREISHPPEIIEISKSSFKLVGTKIFVTLKTSGDPVQFTIGFDKFLIGITSAVTFMNLNIGHVWDMIGGP
jgi:hypothetical protein